MGAGVWEWVEVGVGKRGMVEGEEEVEVQGVGTEEEVAAEEVVQGAGNGGRPAQGAGNGVRATAAGSGGTTTRWSPRPALTPTVTWSSWLWRTRCVT